MICPHCGHEMSRVRVYVECWQYGTLQGNRIVDYGSVEDIGETPLAIVCDECQEDITDATDQGGGDATQA